MSTGADGENYRPDGANKATWFGGGDFTYDAGLSALASVMLEEIIMPTANNVPLLGLPPLQGAEQIINLWSVYFKFNNGRFFANAEYDWNTIDIPLIPAQGPHLEQYHVFTELGMMCGPSKVSAMWAQGSGPVRNNGSSDDLLTGTFVGWMGPTPRSIARGPSTIRSLIRIRTLMFGVYSGGNQVFNGLFIGDDGKGMLSDVFAFAGRLDYAVAANLNVWASYMWAHRLETYGTYMGQYYSDGRDTTDARFQASTALNGDTNMTGQFPGPPAAAGATMRQRFRNNVGIPNAQLWDERYATDGYLGWEVNLGCDWKLLENLTLKTRYAYWQPGPWFSFAYQALGTKPGDPTTYSANAYIGLRDPIQAFEGSFMINF